MSEGPSGLSVCLTSTISLLLAAAFLFFGIYYEDIYCEKPLATWNLVTGILILASLLPIWLSLCCTGSGGSLVSFVALMISLGQLGWFITGNVWLWSMPYAKHVCSNTLFDWSLIMICISWALMAVSLIIMVVICAVS